jgi:hypothetical protein
LIFRSDFLLAGTVFSFIDGVPRRRDVLRFKVGNQQCSMR